MKIKFYNASYIGNERLKYAVIIAKHYSNYVLVRHKKRDTFEFPAGHREAGEKILETAKRELYEETGAVKYKIQYLADYSIEENELIGYGSLFYADIFTFDKLLDYEIAERVIVEKLPEDLTYPIQIKFLEWVNNNL